MMMSTTNIVLQIKDKLEHSLSHDRKLLDFAPYPSVSKRASSFLETLVSNKHNRVTTPESRRKHMFEDQNSN